MTSQANILLMRKHACIVDILCGTDIPNHFTIFLNMDHSPFISRKRTFPVTGVLLVDMKLTFYHKHGFISGSIMNHDNGDHPCFCQKSNRTYT